MENSEYYETSDRLMVIALWSCGYASTSITVDNHNQLVCRFLMSDIWETLSLLLTNQGYKIKVDLAMVWAADNAWSMNLRHLSRYRQ